MGRAASLSFVGVAVALGAASCYRRGDPQLIVQIDADVAVPVQISGRDDASPDAAFDRLRVVTRWRGSDARDNRDFQVGAVGVWPLSFGVSEGPNGERDVELSLTLYKQSDAVGAPDAAPAPQSVAVTRLARATIGDGHDDARVVLHGECVGVVPDEARGVTCVDDPAVLAPATAGVTVAENITAPSVLGSWPRVATVRCAGAPRAGRVCVPGGLVVLGDPAAADAPDPARVAVRPLRAAVMSPFWLDETEVTVSKLRALLSGTGRSVPTADERPGCNFTKSAGDADKQAARCVPFDVARALCKKQGGDLPSAARWEHAARGRGERRRYPWGGADPRCCTSALAIGRGCSTSSPLEVASHATTERCVSADVARDGALDLGGSVREWVLDRPVPWDDPCFGSPGLARDPACVAGGAEEGSARGGSFQRSYDDAVASLRWRVDGADTDVGFRCAWEDKP